MFSFQFQVEADLGHLHELRLTFLLQQLMTSSH